MAVDALSPEYREEVRKPVVPETRAQTTSGLIFHYTPSGSFREILERGTIWLTNAAYLNDPGELIYPAKVAEEALGSIPEVAGERTLSKVHTKESLERFFLMDISVAIRKHPLFRDWYVGSFSLDPNDLSQWRAYCQSGGYAIGFEVSDFVGLIESQSFYAVHGRVEYDTDYQRSRARAIRDAYLDRLFQLREKFPDIPDEQLLSDVVNQCEDLLVKEILFWKNPAFESEGEWRVACMPFGEALRFRVGRSGVLVPYIEMNLKGQGGKLPLAEVWVSPMGDHDLAKYSAGLLLQEIGLSRVGIREAGYGLR